MTTPVSSRTDGSHTEQWTNICLAEKQDFINYALRQRPRVKSGARNFYAVSLHDQRKDSPLKKTITEVVSLTFRDVPIKLSTTVGCWLQFSVAAVGTALIGLSVSIVTAPVGMAASYLLGCPKSFADWTVNVCQVTLYLFINPVSDVAFGLFGFSIVSSVAGVIPTVAWAGLMVYGGVEIYSAFRNNNFGWVEEWDEWLMTSTRNEMMRDYIAPFLDMKGKDLKNRVVALQERACRFCEQSIDQIQSVLPRV